MIDSGNFFDQSIEMTWKHMEILEKLLLVKEIITKLVVY